VLEFGVTYCLFSLTDVLDYTIDCCFCFVDSTYSNWGCKEKVDFCPSCSGVCGKHEFSVLFLLALWHVCLFPPFFLVLKVIRVLAPVYAANLPYNSLSRRLAWILLYSAITYIMLTSLKVLIGMVLQKHARWYVNRCQRRKHHLHAD